MPFEDFFGRHQIVDEANEEGETVSEPYRELVYKLNKKLWLYALENSDKILYRWKAPLDPNFKDKEGTSMLHLAAWYNNGPLAEFLLESGARVDCIDNFKATPLHVAAIFNSSEVAQVLIDKSADPTLQLEEVQPYIPTIGNYSKYVQQLSRMQNGFTPLHCAMAVWSADTILILIHCPNISVKELDNQNRTPLRCLGIISINEDSEARFREVMVALAGVGGIDKNDGYFPMRFAVKQGWLDTVKWLDNIQVALSDKFAPASHQENVLHVAAAAGRTVVMEYLLSLKRCNDLINQPLRNKETALWIAIDKKSVACAQMLLNNLANFKIPFLLHKVLAKDNNVILQRLLVADKKWCYGQLLMQYPDMKGCNCFHLAAQNHTEQNLSLIFELYMQTTRDIPDPSLFHSPHLKPLAETNDKGETPLHCAALAGSAPCCEYLIKCGANISAKTHYKSSAIQMILKNMPSSVTFMENIFNSFIRVAGNDSPIVQSKLADMRDTDVRTFAGSQWIVLNFDIFCQYDATGSQMSALHKCFQRIQYMREQDMMKHPLIQCFVLLKWRRVRLIFQTFLVVYIMFIISLSFTIIINHSISQKENYYYNSTLGPDEMEALHPVSSYTTMVLSVVVMIFLLPDVLFTFLLNPTKFAPLFRAIPPILAFACSFFDPQEAIVNAVYSYNAVFSWMSLIILFGRFPEFGKYAHMFINVIEGLLKFMVHYLCINIGFILGFWVLLKPALLKQRDEILARNAKLREQGRQDEQEYVYDPSLFTEILDVFALWAKVTDYQINLRGENKGTVEIMFFLLIIIGNVGLMRFLLAVTTSNVRKLETYGEFKRLEEQVEFLWQFESIILACHIPFIRKLSRKMLLYRQEPVLLSDIEKILPKHIAYQVFELVSMIAEGHVKEDKHWQTLTNVWGRDKPKTIGATVSNIVQAGSNIRRRFSSFQQDPSTSYDPSLA